MGEARPLEEPNPLEANDDELIASAREGDAAAYGQLVRRYQRAALRVAVADWFGLGSTTIDRTLEPPETTGEAVEQLGSPVDTQQIDLPVALPADLGPPREIREAGPGIVSLTWAASAELPELGDTGIGAALTIRRPGALVGAGSVKVVEGDARIEPITVGDVPGLWIPSEHALLLGPGRPPVTAHRVVLWPLGDLELRLETNLPRDEAVALAAQVRIGPS